MIDIETKIKRSISLHELGISEYYTYGRMFEKLKGLSLIQKHGEKWFCEGVCPHPFMIIRNDRFVYIEIESIVDKFDLTEMKFIIMYCIKYIYNIEIKHKSDIMLPFGKLFHI